jgi:hypothetical protein
MLSLHPADILFSEHETPEPPRMFFVVSGNLVYSQSIHEDSPKKVKHGVGLSEATLWVQTGQWKHRGTARAVNETRLLVLDAKNLQDTLASFPTNHASDYADAFIAHLNGMEGNLEEQMSDLPPSLTVLYDLISDAFQNDSDDEDSDMHESESEDQPRTSTSMNSNEAYSAMSSQRSLRNNEGKGDWMSSLTKGFFSVSPANRSDPLSRSVQEARDAAGKRKWGSSDTAASNAGETFSTGSMGERRSQRRGSKDYPKKSGSFKDEPKSGMMILERKREAWQDEQRGFLGRLAASMSLGRTSRSPHNMQPPKAAKEKHGQSLRTSSIESGTSGGSGTPAGSKENSESS